MTGGCDKSDQSTSIQDQQLESRTVASCDNCPIDDCCCAIELQSSGGFADLRLCGTSNGFGLCSPPTPPSPCSSISGGADAMTLNSTNIRDLFCMNQGNSFSIYNNGMFDAVIKVSCLYDQTDAQFTFITIEPDEYAYFFNDNGCEHTVCQ